MATTRAALTDEDIRTLVRGATPDERAFAARKICRRLDAAVLSEDDRGHAQDILRVMARDAAEMVREALSITLKSSPLVPHDVALQLARDVETVCLPILGASPVFTDADLVEIVRLGEPVRQVAIAKRPQVSKAVTRAIVDHGAESAVEAACANDNADFADQTLSDAVERFERSEQVLAAVAYRNALPLAVTEKLVSMVSEQVRDHLLNRHEISAELALEIAMGAQERATVDLVDQAGRTSDVKAFVSHLRQHDRLTASLLLRALAQGHMTFLEWGLAELASVPHHRTWLMIHDAGPLGLKAVYDRAGLPARLYGAFRAGVDTYHSMEFDGGARDRERFQERMLHRFLTQPEIAGREDTDYLLDKMDRLSGAARASYQEKAEARRQASA
ncbi:hypothetical protein ASE17_05390 [Phenylobacterium sp. Root77]|jgi:uncharacterized protein (DUF2336 family)|uniref:DUF2336 domain-containing protein n=1 Tax=unclassified Phenylobacterium TaxID=2640670 RepID=UPI0006FA296D|nr:MULTISPECIES: DUF2336 domain-containing protein [unclassified Phenylobacterium]KQW66504.1 hypothetical protein ASC73_19235 [Phenylobacterium sp. Root1277]KQW89010.1 hypothetical protein ASC79_20140 [Phenylobacterium sp. Root1290]KRC42134.1 hypothetical protein ASE17_05390 [Phenylobacterium sp. Root77]